MTDIITGMGPGLDPALVTQRLDKRYAEVPFFDDRTGHQVSFLVPGVDIGGEVIPTRKGLLNMLGVDDPYMYEEHNNARTGLVFPCGLSLYPREQLTQINEQDIPRALTKMEFSFLYYIAAKMGELCSTEELIEEVWKHDVSDNNVKVHATRVRTKLSANDNAPNSGLIRVERSTGYGLGGRAFERIPLVFPTLKSAQ
ncbi:MAG: Response regulator receiver [Candidatus Saccharibacteria bacterium]|nr:Response regulator receiver [Candidatus Saccharibacteria bacterium]